MKNKEIMFYSSFIICLLCLFYMEILVLAILFEHGDLFTVMHDLVRITPVLNAVNDILSHEFNFYISLLFFLSLIGSVILIDVIEEELTPNTELTEEK